MADLEFYDEGELQRSAFARILLTGEPKVGKTTTILATAPTPICVLNCDRPGAPQAAIRHGAKDLKILDVDTVAIWEKGYKAAWKLAEEGKVKSIVVDTLTLLVNNTLTLEHGKRFANSFDARRETINCMLAGLNCLFTASAHVFIVAHYDQSDGLISLEGRLKKDIPGLIHDRVHMDYNAKRDPQRCYHIGPSVNGLSGGRSSDENKIIPADVKVLLKELGIEE
jgi:hypothetical protein